MRTADYRTLLAMYPSKRKLNERQEAEQLDAYRRAMGHFTDVEFAAVLPRAAELFDGQWMPSAPEVARAAAAVKRQTDDARQQSCPAEEGAHESPHKAEDDPPWVKEITARWVKEGLPGSKRLRDVGRILSGDAKQSHAVKKAAADWEGEDS